MDEFLVTKARGRGRPVIVGLGAECVVVWNEPGEQNVRGARFDRAGTRQSEFQVNTTRGVFGQPALERIRGGFVVAWIASPPAKVVFQRFARDGTKMGTETVVSDDHVVAELGRLRGPAVAATLDGNFVVSWVAATPETHVRAARFDSGRGARVGSDIVVNSSPGIHFAPVLAAFTAAGLDDVAFTIAWKGGEDGILRSRFQLFNADGSKAGPEVVPKRTDVGEIAPVALGGSDAEDPRELISVLGGTDGTEGQRITADLFIRDGTSLGVTVSGLETVNFDPRVAALPRGGAVVTWTRKPIPTTGQFGTRVMAAIVGVSSGPPNFLTVVGSVTQVGATDVGGQLSASPMLDEFGRSDLAFTWVEQPVGSVGAIKARVLSDSLT